MTALAEGPGATPGHPHRVTAEFDDTDRPVPEATLTELFEAQAARTPNAPAAAHGGTELTYAELNARANRLARLLVARSVGPECFVAVALTKSVDLVVALLAVVKAGAAYLPLDPSHPAERIALMLDDVAPAVVIGRSGDPLPATDADRVLLDDPETVAETAALSAADLTDAERTAPLRPAHPVFVIHTSGSTGRPKGVVVEHRSLNVYLAWARQAYGAVTGRALVHSPVAFDLTATGLYAPLTAGGCVHLVDLHEGSAPDSGTLPEATFVKATPTHLAVLAALPDAYSPTGQLVLGGEALLGEALAEWRARRPDATVINEYGPTETTVGCMEYRIEPGDDVPAGVVTIGRPVWNTRLYVLDEALAPVGTGTVGELYIGGALLARGYHGLPCSPRAASWRARSRPGSACTARATWCADAPTDNWTSSRGATIRSRCAASGSSRGRSRPPSPGCRASPRRRSPRTANGTVPNGWSPMWCPPPVRASRTRTRCAAHWPGGCRSTSCPRRTPCSTPCR